MYVHVYGCMVDVWLTMRQHTMVKYDCIHMVTQNRWQAYMRARERETR